MHKPVMYTRFLPNRSPKYPVSGMVIPIDTIKIVNSQLTATASTLKSSIKVGNVGFSMLLFKMTVNVPNNTDMTTSHFESILPIISPPETSVLFIHLFDSQYRIFIFSKDNASKSTLMPAIPPPDQYDVHVSRVAPLYVPV